MKKITKEDIKKVSGLIKINIDENEVEHYGEQLNTVLSSVDVLNDIDTNNVETTSQTHGLKNILREDVPLKGLNIEDYPNKKNLKDRFFVVKRVIN